jgi:outer membrane biosynthesis protein TonB
MPKHIEVPAPDKSPKAAKEPKKPTKKKAVKKQPAKKKATKKATGKKVAKAVAEPRKARKLAAGASHRAIDLAELHRRIAQRAYQLWERRGGSHGSADQDWHEAERQIRAELTL